MLVVNFMNRIKDFFTKAMENKFYLFLFFLLITTISVFPLFKSGIVAGHDTNFHIYRIIEIKNNLINGRFFYPIYTNLVDGYGYASPLFYSDIFLYVPAVLCCLGMNITISYEIFLFFVAFLSIISMYFCTLGIGKNKKCAVFASFLYAFSSYRFVDIFDRGSLGEILCFIFIPIAIYGLWNIIYDNNKKYYLLFIGMSGVILSHVITTYLVVITFSIVCLYKFKVLMNDKQKIVSIVKATILTILVCAWFLFSFN